MTLTYALAFLIYALGLVAGAVAARRARLRELHEACVMVSLAIDGGATIEGLCGRMAARWPELGVARPHVDRALDALVRERIVRRVRVPHEGRPERAVVYEIDYREE